MLPTVTVGRAFDEGLANLKVNFWTFILIVVILGILDSISNGPGVRNSMNDGAGFFYGPFGGGFLAFFITVFVKPAFDYGAQLVLVRGNRGEMVAVADVTAGFESKDLYIDIILTHLAVTVVVVLGLLAFILPGIYIGSRLVLSSYLVIDKGLAPRQAMGASWELMRGYWPLVIVLGILAVIMFCVGLLLLLVGVFPAIAWVKAMFASFYQQVLDAHDEEFLQSLDITP